MAPRRARATGRWLFWLGLLGTLWLAGTIAAYLSVSGIMRLGTAGRLLASLLMGPMGLPWAFLKVMGVIRETTAQPNLLWLILAGLSGDFLWLSGNLLGAEPNQETLQKQRQAHYARAGSDRRDRSSRETGHRDGRPPGQGAGETEADGHGRHGLPDG